MIKARRVARYPFSTRFMSSSKPRAKAKARKKTNPTTSSAPKNSNAAVVSPVVPAAPPIAATPHPASATRVEAPVSLNKEVPTPTSNFDFGKPTDKFWMGAMAVMILTIVLRQTQLGTAPFHPDETIHAFFSYGFDNYHYDPVYHGPLLYHLTSLFFRLFGQYDYVARLVPSLLGIGLVALILGPARSWLGNRAALVAGGLVAVSPSIVTYSRHLLHDALVLDLTLGAVLSFITALHYPSTDKRGRYALFGLAACLSLFLATKANFFFILVVILAFYGSWLVTGKVRFSLGFSRAWPAALFALVTATAIIFPRDNTDLDPIKDSQHRIFIVVAMLSCALFLFWVTSRKQDSEELEARTRWKGGVDWTTIVLSIALALWIYVFLFGQGAQIIAQWISTKQFPSDTWVSGRESAKHAIEKMLEYWGGQQAKPRLPSRHDYYVVLGILYELPIYIAAMGGIWYAAKQRTVFKDFLLWWAFASWTVYAVANEKVPWLLVHLILPLALLASLWLASLNWRKPLFFAATCAGLLFALRGDVAMVFQRAGDNAEPLLYAQTPDVFRDALDAAMLETRGDSREIWMNGERQWPSVWYLRDEHWVPLKGKSGTPIAGSFTPDRYRIFIAQDTDLTKLKNRDEWNLRTVNFLIWPRVSWTGLQPDRFIRWFWTRETISPAEMQSGPGDSKTSILSGKGEWSHATAVIGSRRE
ncbi:TIGR03663 family protein [bacterium]|nr:MAG: TIGR03663 family protein [bacterium]